ncbi:hypothetical protein CHS0354_017598 [Potamilus streckersoni]|uniref:cAMP-dependent protein kinase inhibitor alpha n=1 Tax=Potamilus streckersoni TaxID=2493646 RepID=A0AAE0RP42_9BIVA|nr:hypothetical protein CHS0354_017598 [Potamilus streckersoni]
MEQQLLQDFLATGRTGRRNALPDILDEQKASINTGSLAFDMNKLSCSDDKGNTSSTEGASGGGGGEVGASNQGS